MKLNIIIVADKRREEMARKLAQFVDADMITWDENHKLGPTGNHRNAWVWANSHPADWTIVLEDDAIPVANFRREATKALTVAPAHVVSFYLGRLRPTAWQSAFEWAVERADDANACWMTGRNVLHAVAIAADRGALNGMVAALMIHQVYQPDAALNCWISKNNADIAYSHPSLVNHNDDAQTLIIHHQQGEYRPGRVAWKHGTRRKWTSDSVPLVAPGAPRTRSAKNDWDATEAAAQLIAPSPGTK
jgi:hypothetical protein